MYIKMKKSSDIQRGNQVRKIGTQPQNNSTFQVEDNRLNAGKYQAIQRLANNSRQVTKLKAIQRQADNRNGNVTENDTTNEEHAPSQHLTAGTKAAGIGADGPKDSTLEGSAKSPEQTEAMLTRLAEAESALLLVMKQAKTTGQVAAVFPMLQEKYGLKSIEIEDLGTSKARVKMQINPVAYIQFLSNNTFSLSPGNSYNLGDKQRVYFKTGQSPLGDTWGLEMIARQLGPNHPQGFGPKGQRNLMRVLPTLRKLFPGSENHFIRGHLLNDNLGGPGLPENMFPITEKANHEHEQYVEAYVKDWVNNKGYFVYYHVKVQITDSHIVNKNSLNDPDNYINANFICEAYPIDATGKRSKENKYIHYTIRSVYKSTAHNPLLNAESTPKGVNNTDISHKKIATSGKVELSKTKSKEPAFYNALPDEAVEVITEFRDTFKSFEKNYSKQIAIITGVVEKSLKGISRSSLATVIKIAVFGDHSTNIFTHFKSVGAWNKYINKIKENLHAITDSFSELTDLFELYSKLNSESKKLIASKMGTSEKYLLRNSFDKPQVFMSHYQKLGTYYFQMGIDDINADKKQRSSNAQYLAGYQKRGKEIHQNGYLEGKSGKDPSSDHSVFRQGHAKGLYFHQGYQDFKSNKNTLSFNPDFLEGRQQARKDVTEMARTHADGNIAPQNNHPIYVLSYKERMNEIRNMGRKDANNDHQTQTQHPVYLNSYRARNQEIYNEGRNDANNSRPSQSGHSAYRSGFIDRKNELYNNGYWDARRGQPLNPNFSIHYASGHADGTQYRIGHQQGMNDQNAGSNNSHLREGHQDALNEMYDRGYNAGRNNRQRTSNHSSYRSGYNSGQDRRLYRMGEDDGYDNHRAAYPHNRSYMNGYREGQNDFIYDRGYDDGRSGYRPMYQNNRFYMDGYYNGYNSRR